MPRWLDEIEATSPDEEPASKKLLAAGLVVVAVAVVGFVVRSSAPEPIPAPPSADQYLKAFPHIADARYDDSVLALQVEPAWTAIDKGDRVEHLVGLLEITGTFEFTAIEVTDTAGARLATVDPDGAIRWHR